MLSLLCRHYRWTHDFWRRMGLREFRAWCDQLSYEQDKERRKKDSWKGSENDPGWQSMRAKRDRQRGR